MEIKEIANKEKWEEFLSRCPEKTFLQSWNWGEFQLKNGNKIWRLSAYYNEKIIGVCLVIKICARRGIFLLIPHGPVFMQGLNGKDKKEVLELLLFYLKNIAEQEKVGFIRISPLFLREEKNEDIFAELGFKEAPMHSSAYDATWKIDIVLPEDELLKNMRKTSRYLIKKSAENKDIEIIKSSNLKDIGIYQELNREVSRRQKFVPFPDNFIKNEFEVFAKDNQAVLFWGKYKNEIAAGALIIFWSGIAFYHQAASLGKFAKMPLPYLLMWEAIKEAKKRRCAVFDFWGFTDPEKFPKHPWAGPTLFKMGFGGYKTEYVKTQDYVLSNRYWINYIIEKFRKTKRGL